MRKVLEAKQSPVKKNCKLLLKMIGEVNKGCVNKLKQIISMEEVGEENKATIGQLDEARELLDEFIGTIMKMKV